MGDGQMKITRSKFYRISGESTQHKGVMPSITMPDLYEASPDIGESALPTALPWDTIEPNFYRPYADLRLVLPTLNSRHEERLKIDPDFAFIQAEIARARQQQQNNLLTLNQVKLQSERDEQETWRLEQENKRRVAKGKPPLQSFDELEAMAEASAAEAEAGDAALEASTATAPEAADESEEAKEPDPYLVESGKILLDLISLQGSGGSRVAGTPAGSPGQKAL